MTLPDPDYLPDEALAKIEALIPTVAQDFELVINNAWAKSVQALFKWTRPDDVYKRADSVINLVEVAMCVDTLCKNLRDARTTPEWALVVPRSFVESVMYSGSFELEDLQKLWAQAEELLS